MKPSFLCAVLGTLAAPLAHAHVTLEPASAPAGAYRKLTFKVGHGCDGSATTGITVQLPESVIGAHPMPKAGWTISLTEAKLATPVQSHGKSITSAVREVSWKGGPLPDSFYDEFSMQVKLPDTAGTAHFKVIQQCEQGRSEWSEIAAAGGARLRFPAPALDIVPASPTGHQH